MNQSLCSSPFPYSWMFRLCIFSLSLNKQYCIEHASSLLRKGFSSTPEKHPYWVLNHYGYQPSVSCWPELFNIFSSQFVSSFPTVSNTNTQSQQTPQLHGLATSFLHLILNFSPKSRKPHRNYKAIPAPVCNSLSLLSASAFAYHPALWTLQRPHVSRLWNSTEHSNYWVVPESTYASSTSYVLSK